MIVGIYTTVLASVLTSVLSFFIPSIQKNVLKFIFFFFTLGFIKHFLGFYLGLQTFYCNYGKECSKRVNNKNLEAITPSFFENLLEGIVFVVFGLIFKNIFSIFKYGNNIYLISFFTGFFLHFITDMVGVHTFFCKYYCK
jgi:ribose/xylose/arabinose/galactoside ABC-type transport system permease subunit